MGIDFDYDKNCSQDPDIRKLYEAQTILFTYYYLARMYLQARAGDELSEQFGYPEARFHVQWIDLDPQEGLPLPEYSFANLVPGIVGLQPQRFLPSIADMTGRYRPSIEFFLEKALEYESRFEDAWSDEVEPRLDETLVKDVYFLFSDFGFFANSDGCYQQGAYANIARIPIIGGRTYISFRGFEEYIYGFWYRRTKEGTRGIAKRYIRLALDELRVADFSLIAISWATGHTGCSGPSRIEREPQDPPQSPRIPRRGAIREGGKAEQFQAGRILRTHRPFTTLRRSGPRRR